MGPGENDMRREVLVPASPENGDGAFDDADEGPCDAVVGTYTAEEAKESQDDKGSSKPTKASPAKTIDSVSDFDEDDLHDVITFQSYLRASVATASTTTSPRSAGDVSMRSMLAEIMETEGSPTDRRVQQATAAGDVSGSKHSPLTVHKRAADSTPIFSRFAQDRREDTPELSGTGYRPGHGQSGNSTASSAGAHLVTPRNANTVGTTSSGFAPSAYKLNKVSPLNGTNSGLHRPTESAASAMSSMTDPSFDLHHLRTSTPTSHLGSPSDDEHRDSGGSGIGPAYDRVRAGTQTPSPISAANAIALAGMPLTAKQAQSAASLSNGGRAGLGNGDSTTPKPRRLMEILPTPGKIAKATGLPLRVRSREGAVEKDKISRPITPAADRLPLQPLRNNQAVQQASSGKQPTYSPTVSMWGNKIPSPTKAANQGARPGLAYLDRSPQHRDRENEPHHGRSTTAMGFNGDRYHARGRENNLPSNGRSTTAMGFNDDRHRVARPRSPAEPEAYVRPATAMTHRQHRDFTFNPYSSTGNGAAPGFGHEVFGTRHPSKAIPQATHRPIVDFSRRMSDQRAFGVTSSLTADSGPADNSFDIATRALDKMRAEQAAADEAAFDMCGTPRFGTKTYGAGQGQIKGQGQGKEGGSPRSLHERQESAGSLRTEESSFTARTAGTGVTGTSLEGEWELERYLRPVDA